MFKINKSVINILFCLLIGATNTFSSKAQSVVISFDNPSSSPTNLSSLANIDKIEIDQIDFCGTACTSATLSNNGTIIASASNANSSVPEMLVINNTSQLSSDELVLSSSESLIYEIRIFTSQNSCGNVNIPVISGLPFFCFTTQPITLSGMPAGGIFSGPGMFGNIFYPNVAGIGSHFISYTYTDVNGCSATETKRVYVIRVKQPIVFNPLKTDNPENEIGLEIEASEAGEFNIELFDMSGRTIHHQISNFNEGFHYIKIQPNEELTSGIYIISIANKNGRTTKKIKL